MTIEEIKTKFDECYAITNTFLESQFLDIVKKEIPDCKVHSIVFEQDDNVAGKFFVSVYTQPATDPHDSRVLNAEKQIRDFVTGNMCGPLRYFFAPSFNHTFTYIR